jgi:hypothetical protein
MNYIKNIHVHSFQINDWHKVTQGSRFKTFHSNHIVENKFFSGSKIEFIRVVFEAIKSFMKDASP